MRTIKICIIQPLFILILQNSGTKIRDMLKFVGAKRGIGRQDYYEKIDETRKMDRVKEGTQSLCIGSVLIATVTSVQVSPCLEVIELMIILMEAHQHLLEGMLSMHSRSPMHLPFLRPSWLQFLPLFLDHR